MSTYEMPLIAAIIIAIAFLLSVLNIGLMLYVSQKKLHLVQAKLTGCKLISDTKSNVLGLGFIGRFFALSITAIILILSRTLSGNKLVDPDEIRRLPKELRRWVTVPVATSWALLVVILIASFWLD